MSPAVEVQSIVAGDKAGHKAVVSFHRGTVKRTVSVTLGSQKNTKNKSSSAVASAAVASVSRADDRRATP